ncbi:hypothetical protein ACHAQA_009621 [Verticillium albo-atrum]
MADSSPEPSLFVGSDEYDQSSLDGHNSFGDVDDDSDDVQIMANGGDSPGASPPVYHHDDDDLFVPDPLSDDQSPHRRSIDSLEYAPDHAPTSPFPEPLDLQNQRADRRDVEMARDMALGLPGVLGDLDWMDEIGSDFDIDDYEDLEAELQAQNHHIRQPHRAAQPANRHGIDGNHDGREEARNLLHLLENNGARRSSAARPPNRPFVPRRSSPVNLDDIDWEEDYGFAAADRLRNARDVLVDVELLPEGRLHAPPSLARPQLRQPGATEVIDLTNEPDSPVQAHARPASLNVRRQNSQARNPPAFARSDSSILGGPPVIDLTDDAPDRPGLRRNFMHNLPFLNFFTPDPADPNLDLVEGMMNNPFNPVGHIQLQYQHGAFDHRPPSPKPVHVPPPPARSGFSRDTKADSSSAYVCPACNEELAYDPLEASTSEPQPSRSTRLGKRHRSEHHFWALKGCGHVYCEDCYENRKPTNKRPNTGFLHGGRDQKLSCAVEGCDTQVANKGSWVGIYL